MSNEIKWRCVDVGNDGWGVRVGTHEFQDIKGEWHVFEVITNKEKTHLVFGGATNNMFLQSGYLKIDKESETFDEALREMIADLQTYYDDGKQYTTRIVCNDRM